MTDQRQARGRYCPEAHGYSLIFFLVPGKRRGMNAQKATTLKGYPQWRWREPLLFWERWRERVFFLKVEADDRRIEILIHLSDPRGFISSHVGLVLGQRRRLWRNTKPTLAQYLVSARVLYFPPEMSSVECLRTRTACSRRQVRLTER